MSATDLEKKKMSSLTMLAKVDDVLKRGRATDAPAYTLILGAGASFGVVPTAKEMLGFPDAKTGKIHEKSVPIWLAKQLESCSPIQDEVTRLECSKGFWKTFILNNSGNLKCGGIRIEANGFPSATSIAAAYQAIFETSCVGGLDTPERHRNYMREVTMAAEPGSAQLNATHFYLASLLSLQKRSGDLGSDKKPLYTGRREFARTIFTTNFDPLLQTSLQLFQLLYYMTDRPEFLSADALQTDHHPAMHLFYAHGSVHRPYMANTDEQIILLKQQNARGLAAYLGSHGVIVLGYSGWDDCLLEALNQTKTFSNNLYWLARSASSVSENVIQFLASHPNAYWVEIDDGGNFMAELHSRLCPGAPNTEMLYNPIRPLLSQLGCVSLVGVQASNKKNEPAEKNDDEKASLTASEFSPDVESIRQQVIVRLQDAQKLFTELPKHNVHWKELERQADLSYVNKDWDAALGVYDQLLKMVSILSADRTALAFFRRGVCHGEKKETDKAITDYTAVIELPSAPAEQIAKARVNRGICYGQKGETDKAIADDTAVIELSDASPEQIAKARFNRGICYSQKGETDKEIADYTAVIELSGAPTEQIAKARFNRGICYSQTGETDKAIADYTAVIEMAGASSEQIARARVNRGFRYSQKGETDKAIADYTAVIELPGAPTEQIAKARLNRGIGYGKKGETDKEIADYTAVTELADAPTEQIAKALINRGICYSQKGETDKAIADYTAVIELAGATTEDIAKARFNRGVCYSQKGEKDKVIADCTAVIELPEAPAEVVKSARNILESMRSVNTD